MKKALIALAACAAIGGCSHRQSSGSTTAGAADTTTTAEDSWVAQAGDLQPEQVRMVQRALNERGFQVDPSGTFDAVTQTALSDFQRSRGLPATGNLNADTADALGIAPDDVRPVRGGATPNPPANDTVDEKDPARDDANRRPGQPPQPPEDADEPEAGQPDASTSTPAAGASY